VSPIADLDVMERRKIVFACQESNPGRPACIVIAIPTELSRLLDCRVTNLTAPSRENNAHNGDIKSIFSLEVEAEYGATRPLPCARTSAMKLSRVVRTIAGCRDTRSFLLSGSFPLLKGKWVIVSNSSTKQ
jgi:hypothetical protein